jgi:hypothetical protein
LHHASGVEQSGRSFDSGEAGLKQYLSNRISLPSLCLVQLRLLAVYLMHHFLAPASESSSDVTQIQVQAPRLPSSPLLPCLLLSRSEYRAQTLKDLLHLLISLPAPKREAKHPVNKSFSFSTCISFRSPLGKNKERKIFLTAAARKTQ